METEMSAPQAAILLSRQPLRPCRTTPWVRTLLDAIRHVRDRNLTLITSVGMPTYEMAISAAACADIEQRICIPAADSNQFQQRKTETCRQFRLDPELTDFVPVLPPDSRIKPKALMVVRDRAVIEQADILIPVSVRPGGVMERLLDRYASTKTLVSDYRIPYEPGDNRLKYEVAKYDLNPGLGELSENYLIHWTRAANGPWPDETRDDYYRSIMQSDHYPRDAFATLLHILGTRRLLASARHMPAGIATVSFSGLPPADVIPLMRWRARYAEMSFEPYGIGIRKDRALKSGIREVLYYDPTFGNPSSDADRWRRQSVGTKTDWRQEAEYRTKQNVRLDEIDESELLVFCFYPRQAARIVMTAGLPAMSIKARD